MKFKKQILSVMVLITLINANMQTISNAETSSPDITSTTQQETSQNTISTQYEQQEANQNTIPEPNFKIYSDGAVLMDSNTGKVLAGKDINKKVYPASTTKILTAIIAIENCKLDEQMTARRNAVMSIPSGYSNAGIQVGETLSFQDLLDMFLIHSANEIGFIFAEHISGSVENFADLMNQKAAELGCTNTHFTNPSGIHDVNHYTTAYDMALIARYCMKNETFRETVSKTSCKVAATDKYQERYFKNTNDLIDSSSRYYYQYAIGVKTGFTTQAKNCLIGASLKDGVELIAVALGAEATDDGRSGRYMDTISLFDYGFANYKFQEIATANNVMKEIIIPNATKETENLSLLLKNSISTTVPTDFDITTLNPSITLNDDITAPIAEGTVLGKISYNIDGIEYTSELIASHNVEKSKILLIIGQIILSILVLIVLAKLLSPKKKNKNFKTKKSKRKCDSIYRFR